MEKLDMIFYTLVIIVSIIMIIAMICIPYPFNAVVSLVSFVSIPVILLILVDHYKEE